MLDITLVNRVLGSVEGVVYQPVAEDAPGLFFANDSLVCVISRHGDYLHLRVPIVYPDELESEDIRLELGEDTDFYQEEIEQFSYFLKANRYADVSRGLCICLDPELEAISLNCKVLCMALTGNGLQQLVYSLFMIVLEQRLELFPDEVDPEAAKLVAGNGAAVSLNEPGKFMGIRV